MQPGQVDYIMDELERSRVFEVIITGGEPLLNKRALYRMLDRIERLPLLRASINTSLIGLTGSDVERLGRYSHLVSILTSMMGPTADIHDMVASRKGAFKKTVHGIELLVQAGLAVSANMVVSRLNREYILETAELCKGLGVKMFNATRAASPLNCPDFSPYALDLQEFRTYLTDLGAAGRASNIPVGVLTVYPMCGVRDINAHSMTFGRRCSAGVSVAAISATGEFRPCTHVQESAGNIFSEPLTILWGRLLPWRDGSLIPSTCKTCRALPLCGGGCRADSLVVNGSLRAEDPLMQLEDVEAAIAGYRLEQQKRRREVVIPSILRLNPELRWRREPIGSVWFLRRCIGIFDSATTGFLEGLVGKDLSQTDLKGTISPQFLIGLVERRILIAGEGSSA
jgi:radical SAM protein with 4Fe4S-binding SPASM domain